MKLLEFGLYITTETYIEASINIFHFYNQVRRNAKVVSNLT